MRRRLRISAALITLVVILGCGRDERPSAGSALLRGDELVSQGRFGDAATSYRLAVEGRPRDAAVRLKLAEALLQTGDWAGASQEMVRVADLRTDDIELQVRAAALMAIQTNFIDARDRAGAVLRQRATHVDALKVWANAMAEQQFADSALQEFDRSYRAGRGLPIGQEERAMRVSKERDVDAEGALRRAMLLAPADLTARVALANLQFVTGRRDEAAQTLREVVDERTGPSAWVTLPYDPTAGVSRILGEWYAFSGKPVEAERYLRHAIDNGDGDAYVPLADHLIAAGRAEEGRELLARLPPGFDTSGMIAVRLARLSLDGGQEVDALKAVEAALTRQPRLVPALLLKAEVRRNHGDWAEVIALARAALASDHASTDARLLLAEGLEESGERQAAFDELTDAIRSAPDDDRVAGRFAALAVVLGKPAEAVSYARSVTHRRPDDRAARLVLARALTATGDHRGAETELKRLLVAQPDTPNIITALGGVQVALGNGAGARASFTRALQLDPDLPDALSGLAALELQERRPAAARLLVDAALARRPDSVRHRLLAARVAEATNDAPRAEQLAREILRRDSRHEEALTRLARALAAQSREQEAVTLLQSFGSDAKATELRTVLGEMLERLGRLDEARALYERIAVDDFRATTAATRLARLHLAAGNLDKALELATEVRRQSVSAEINELMGAIYLRKSLPGSALTFFQEAVRARPDSASVRYQLGTAHQQIRQYREARQELTRALQLDPQFPEAAAARAALASLPNR